MGAGICFADLYLAVGCVCVAIAARQYVACLTSCVRRRTIFFHSCAQNSRSRTLIAPLQQLKVRGPSTFMAALSSCLLCRRRILGLVLTLRELSCELIRMTLQRSSCSLGLVMSSRGTREAEDAESPSVLGRLLATAGRSDCHSHHSACPWQQARKRPSFVHSPIRLPC